MLHAPELPTAKSPLCHTELEVMIKDLVAEHVIRHRYVNKSDQAIEAIFTFPIPLDAAFLGMQATIAGETLTAQIQAKHKASREYDDAIASGNSSVLLTSPEPGVICSSLGNLLPNESCEIELRFVTALRVADHTARFSLPLVHRPRFGNWSLDELEAPTLNFAIKHPMSAIVRVEGLLVDSPVSCLTHSAQFTRTGVGMELSINHAMLDRDLVLTFELSTNIPTIARLIEDGDATLGMLSFVLPQSDANRNPLDLCLVLDCSGSMAGDAIEQSREAMIAIAGALGAQDRVQILRFGSTVVPMFRRPLLATEIVRKSIRELTATINADLGGTEMEKALSLAMNELEHVDPERSKSIILVTDGAVQPENIRNVQSKANDANLRIFVVAVGSSAGVEVLQPMAEATNAVLERAVPAEPINAIVMRQFRRAKELGPVNLDINWQNPMAESINTGVFYPGDAVFTAAYLPNEFPTIKARLHNGECIFEDAPCYNARESEPALRALLGQLRYKQSRPSVRESIAIQYGLLTSETSAVLVKVRANGEKTSIFPVICQVPQMESAGRLMLMVNPCYSIPLESPTFCSRSQKAFQGDVVIKHRKSIKRNISSADDHLINDMQFLYKENMNDEVYFSLRDGSEVKLPNSIPSLETRDIFQALFDLLRATLNDINNNMPELRNVILRLPRSQHGPAVKLVFECDLKLKSVSHAIILLIALQKHLGAPNFSENEEAMLAVKSIRRSNSIDIINTLDTSNQKLDEKINSLLLNGL